MELSSIRSYSRMPDQLLGAAFAQDHGDIQAAVSKVDQLNDQAASLLLEPWESDPRYTVRGLRIAAMYACAPSLRTVASSQAHKISTAQEVADNMQDMCAHLVSPRFEVVKEKPEHKAQLIGQLSEIAVLAAMWWGVANGYRDERSYMLPATKKEDVGYSKGGYKFAADLVLRQKSGKKQFIQVKNGYSRSAKRAIEFHHPELAIVIVNDLAESSSSGPAPLLKAVASNHRSVLEVANQKIDDRLSTASKRGVEHRRQSRSQQVALA